MVRENFTHEAEYLAVAKKRGGDSLGFRAFRFTESLGIGIARLHSEIRLTTVERQ
jgi:hypothetical protein